MKTDYFFVILISFLTCKFPHILLTLRVNFFWGKTINFKDLHCYKKIAQAYIEIYNFVLFLFIKNVLL